MVQPASLSSCLPPVQAAQTFTNQLLKARCWFLETMTDLFANLNSLEDFVQDPRRGRGRMGMTEVDNYRIHSARALLNRPLGTQGPYSKLAATALSRSKLLTLG